MTRIGFRSTTVADESAIRSLLLEAHEVAPGHPMFEVGILLIAHAAIVPGALFTAAAACQRRPPAGSGDPHTDAL